MLKLQSISEEDGHLSCKGGRLGSLSKWEVVSSYWHGKSKKISESKCLPIIQEEMSSMQCDLQVWNWRNDCPDREMEVMCEWIIMPREKIVRIEEGLGLSFRKFLSLKNSLRIVLLLCMKIVKLNPWCECKSGQKLFWCSLL